MTARIHPAADARRPANGGNSASPAREPPESTSQPPYPGWVNGWPLTGRDEEMRRIYDSVTSRDGSGIVLSGPAGVGKTRLAREAAVRAQRHGHRIHTISATASAQSIPLGAFTEFAATAGSDPLLRISAIVDAIAGPPAPTQPVVTVDDAHLLDHQSTLVVQQLITQRRARVILTIRHGETVPDAVRALWKDELLPLLQVQPLSAAEVTTLVESGLGGQVESSTAQRLWEHTHGNVLYLRQLLADEAAAGHIVRVSGVFVWTGTVAMSSTLAELVGASVGRQPQCVLVVVDALAVAGPLDLPILADICGIDAVDAAQAAGVIVISDGDIQGPTAQLAHPLYGEVRLSTASTLGLRHLRGKIAQALRNRSESITVVDTVRVATLISRSDLTPSRDDLVAGSRAALELLDTATAEAMAAAAVAVEDTPTARWALFYAQVGAGHLTAALHTADALRTHTSNPRFRALIDLRCAMAAATFGEIATMETHLARVSRDDSARHGYRDYHKCVLGIAHAMRREWDDSITALESVSTDTADGAGRAALIVALAATGHISRTHDLFEQAWAVARNLPTPRSYGLAEVYSLALEVGGELHRGDKLAARIATPPLGHTQALGVRALALGNIADAQGDLATSQRWLREAGAHFSSIEFSMLSGIRLRPFRIGPRKAEDPDEMPPSFVTANTAPLATAYEPPISKAWFSAQRGALTEAHHQLRADATAAAKSRAHGIELMLRQLATQLGDAEGANRLAELTRLVDGPRVKAAARHATAFAAGNADDVLGAATAYEAFGDRVAAADAAAQAACLYREQGRRGAAMTATAMSDRIAAETGQHTPARSAITIPVPLTGRQREILALAATGLTNQQIADRLTMSVRTVEGHIFRATQRTGVAGRSELIALIQGQPRSNAGK
jgi:DNA-binding CsgD family transcriptional regulator